MCGIFGAIGKSKDTKATRDLFTSLYLKTEHRGTDATGYYGCAPGDGLVIYDKEPIKSSEYIKTDPWCKTFYSHTDVDLFIAHCRQTSVGGGPEKINKNNHPHWSNDRRVAMVHNGKIPEFSVLKHHYDIESDCDSEILLRMFESSQVIAKDREEELKKEFPTLAPFLADRLVGLKEIFSRVNYGAMATAIAERGDDHTRYMWLFRDEERPLHVVDMRPTLGQIFFCSTAEIWRNAVEITKSAEPYIPKDQVIIEVPSYQIWLLGYDPNKEKDDDKWNIKKFKVTKTRYIDWKQEEPEENLSFKRPKNLPPSLPPMKTICRLGENDEIEKPVIIDVEPVEAQGKKKISAEGGGRSARGSAGGILSAKVNVGDPGDETAYHVRDNAVVREPGDESETDASPVLKDSTLVETEEEIDLNVFTTAYDQIEKDLDKIKTEVLEKAEGKTLGPKDFSIIIDHMENIRSEAADILNHLSK